MHSQTIRDHLRCHLSTSPRAIVKHFATEKVLAICLSLLFFLYIHNPAYLNRFVGSWRWLAEPASDLDELNKQLQQISCQQSGSRVDSWLVAVGTFEEYTILKTLAQIAKQP